MSVSAVEESPVGRSAIRKASWRLLPLIGLGYGLAGIDRKNISFASLQMNRDLHFSATMYGLVAGLFFLSYAACQVPSNLLLYKVGSRRWLASIMMLWGVVATGMMFVRTPMEFYELRFVLGIAEAGFFPGVMYTLATWFPVRLRARTVSRFYISWPLSGVLMGVLAGWLLGLQGKLGMAGWEWLFMVEGLPAVLLGAVFWLMLPDGPSDAKWLSVDEKSWLIQELKNDGGGGQQQSNLSEVLRVMVDLRVIAMGVLMLCMLSCDYGYVFSGPAILQQVTGWSTTAVGYLVAAMMLLGAPAMMLTSIHSDKSGERHWHVLLPFLLMMVSFWLSGYSHSKVVVVAALTVAELSVFAMQGPLWTIICNFYSGRKAATAIAAVNMIGITGGFWGPMWMGVLKDKTGDYNVGLMTLALPSLLGAVIVLVNRMQSKRKTLTGA